MLAAAPRAHRRDSGRWSTTRSISAAARDPGADGDDRAHPARPPASRIEE